MFYIDVLREVLNDYLQMQYFRYMSWLLLTSWKKDNTLLIGNVVLLLKVVDQIIMMVIVTCILNIF